MIPGGLDDKIAIVTGAGGGIGRASALQLARAGCDVAVADVHQASVAETARLVAATGRRASVVVADLTRRAEAQRVVDEAVARFGTLDFLVNTVGWYPTTDFGDISEEQFDAVLDVNAKAVFTTMQAVAPILREKRAGRIVNIVSIDACIPKPRLVHYAAAKAAVWSMIKSVALDLAPYNVLVNGIAPGHVNTEAARRTLPAWRRAELVGETPLGRLAEPDEIAGIVEFLCSPAAGFITGECIVASGGNFMQ